MKADRQTLARAREDIAVFATLAGAELWPHQLRLAEDPAKIRIVLAGRQSGKSRTSAVLAIHTAFAASGRRVLVVSSGESAARDLLSEITALCSSPLLAGSVVDESASLVRLSNGSEIRSVPASQRAVRGRSVDLLICDEAAFVSEEIWTAARFTTIARPGSRIVLASSPWGSSDAWFRQAYETGEAGEAGYSSHHWEATDSPLVDESTIEMYRATMSAREYEAEILGHWVDARGGYFSPVELEAAVELGGPDGSPVLDPSVAWWRSVGNLRVECGVDWASVTDASTLVGVAEVPAELEFFASGRLWLPVVLERFGQSYSSFIAELLAMGAHRAGIRYGRIATELNGVGQMPSQELRRRAAESGVCRNVEGITTTLRSKEDGFGAVRLLLQRGGLVLPRHPALLRQLGALEYEQLEGGSVRISVPSRLGHDDLAMGLCLAMSGSVKDAQSWSGAARGHYRYRQRALRGTR